MIPSTVDLDALAVNPNQFAEQVGVHFGFGDDVLANHCVRARRLGHNFFTAQPHVACADFERSSVFFRQGEHGLSDPKRHFVGFNDQTLCWGRWSVAGDMIADSGQSGLHSIEVRERNPRWFAGPRLRRRIAGGALFLHLTGCSALMSCSGSGPLFGRNEETGSKDHAFAQIATRQEFVCTTSAPGSQNRELVGGIPAVV
jgi:hypothetical protein